MHALNAAEPPFGLLTLDWSGVGFRHRGQPEGHHGSRSGPQYLVSFRAPPGYPSLGMTAAASCSSICSAWLNSAVHKTCSGPGLGDLMQLADAVRGCARHRGGLDGLHPALASSPAWGARR